jgi:hypothetical protein
MHRTRTLLITAAATAAVAPAAAIAAPGPLPLLPPSDEAAPAVPAPSSAAVAARAERLRDAGADQRRAVRRVMRLAQRRERLGGADAPRRAEIAGWTTARLDTRSRRLRATVRELRRTGGAPDVAIPGALKGIAQCESGGNPRAVSADGTYRGLFQFDAGTWASVGGSGDPAAASAEEQYRRAALLYARAGASPWPVCGR